MSHNISIISPNANSKYFTMILIISSQVVNSVLLAQVGAARFLNDFSAIILLACKILMLHVFSKV